MGAGLEQSAHGKFWQSHGFSLLYRLARRAGYPFWGTPDGDVGTPGETHPRVRDGGLIRFKSRGIKKGGLAGPQSNIGWLFRVLWPLRHVVRRPV